MSTQHTLTLLYVGCVRFPHSNVAPFIVLFSSLVHQPQFSLQLVLFPHSRRLHMLISAILILSPSSSLPISPFLLLTSLLPRSALPVFCSAHCLASPTPSFLPASSSSSSSSPPIVICFCSQRFFFYRITAFSSEE